jgi:hypothetical protein
MFKFIQACPNESNLPAPWLCILSDQQSDRASSWFQSIPWNGVNKVHGKILMILKIGQKMTEVLLDVTVNQCIR